MTVEAPPKAAPTAPSPGGRWKEWSLALAVRLCAVLPRSWSYALARIAGDAACFARANARRGVEDNMRHVLGAAARDAAVRRYAREVFRNVARYYTDLARLSRTTPQTLLAEARLHDFDRLKSRLDAGRSVIVATAHYGNPEIAVQVGAVLGLNVLVLAEPLQPPAFARLMTRIRNRYGARYEDVGYHAISAGLRHLRAGGCLAIACDRDIQHKGALIPFFGFEARMPLGAVELAARTGSLLMPAYCRRARRGFDVYFEEPIELVDTGRPKDDALSNTRALLSRVEAWIRADPGQWMPLEAIWGTSVPASPPRPSEEQTGD